jgi:hypothetical protein
MLLDKGEKTQVIVLYLIYNIFLKFLCSLIAPILYIENINYSESINFTIWKNSLFESIFVTIYCNLILDLFWLLPFTLVNVFIFYKWLNKFSMDYINSLILKIYIIWCLLYGFSLGVKLSNSSDGLDLSFWGPYAPHGYLIIVYFLIGNFLYFNIVLPLLNMLYTKLIIDK